ncbi:5,6-dimethylbenzimidazole synthase [Streptomyces venezuelae]|uniref:Nicotinate-nucleotide--dimethylbenzimidazole phosphoribosyltransferase n=1 Tax=Streptomyces venezuelae TaxID=54571 RepID=A0A5P2D9X7_STRVZ|nr:nicotinate-nucleotide--dimethylbenzimidazole phosphoribosyltransferase [Streptomyces venezuelae]QES50997.1 5,6-dimethylbenzimidazole synthase [Streptomyces venezuelae]
MTDTGQVPGEGLPDDAGMAEQQQGIPVPVPAPGAYAFQDLADNPGEDEDELLLMPSGQGSWSDPQVVPPVPAYPVEGYTETPYVETPYAETPYAEAGYAEAPYADGAHEAGGRDSGSLDLGGLRVPPPVPPMPAAPVPPARRPLHMGPPVPDASGGVVRSLADRGPAQVPAPAPAPAPAQVPVQAPAPVPAPAAPVVPPVPVQAQVQPGPEYLDLPVQTGGPWQAVAEPAETVVQVPEPPSAETRPEQPAEPALAPQPAPGPEDGGLLSSAVPAGQVAAEPVAEAGGLLPTDIAPEPLPAMPEPVEVPQPVAEVPDAPEVPQVPEVPQIPEVPQVPEAEAEPVPVPAVEEPPALDLTAAPAEPVAMAAPEEQPAAPAEPLPDAVVAEAVPEPEAEAEPALPEPEPAPEQAAPAEPVEPAELVEPAEPAEPVEPAQPVEAANPIEPAAPVEVVELLGPDPYLTPAVEPEPTEQAAAPQPVPAAQPAPVEEAPQPVSAGEPAPGYADAEREAVLRVMRERRDIRNGFRTDPIPHEVLLRVLEAAHTAPSVGHSQPWDFVVIRSAETRRTMHELAERQREAYAKSLPKGRAKQFKEMKIEAILDTPVNIVVTADPTRGGRHTLGRHTQPQMAPYSSALAVENLWLAARAEGLGVGWVSFFDEREMVRTLGLPEHLEVVAYLCIGYVDEFPDEPELMQAGWSKRRPLSWVVHEETYGRRALPGEEPHDLLSETVSGIRPLDAKALGEAWERQKRMTKPAGALGMLEIISAQLAGLSRVCPPPIPEPAAVAIFAGDHGVHAQGVTPWPQEVTSQMVANFLGGGAVCNAFANQVGAEVCVIDVGVAGDLPATPGLLPRKVRPGTADLSTGPAMSREEAVAAIEVGIETARDLVAAGNKGLLTGEMGIANTTVSAALISVFTGVDPAEVTGRGTGINDETHARKVDVVRRALELHRPDPADPIGVLAAIGGLEHAAMVGLILGAASLRTPVILDGVSAGAAALVARAIAPESLSACIAGHRSAEPGHVAALNKLGLRPLVDLDLRLGEGTGALLALPLVQSAARAMHEVATFDSAGVTEK